MTEYFKHDYVKAGEFFSDEIVLCMRCGTQVKGIAYSEIFKKNHPKEKVNVVGKKAFSNFRIIPMEAEINGKKTNSSLILCSDCENASISAEECCLATAQIISAHFHELKWNGHEIQNNDPMATFKILGRKEENNGSH